jgi:hypothetical protein
MKDPKNESIISTIFEVLNNIKISNNKISNIIPGIYYDFCGIKSRPTEKTDDIEPDKNIIVY